MMLYILENGTPSDQAILHDSLVADIEDLNAKINYQIDFFYRNKIKKNRDENTDKHTHIYTFDNDE